MMNFHRMLTVTTCIIAAMGCCDDAQTGTCVSTLAGTGLAARSTPTDTNAVPALLACLRGKDAAARLAAWTSLGSQAMDSAIGPMYAAAFATTNREELAIAMEATRQVYARAIDKTACFDVIAGYYDAAPTAGKMAIVGVASSIGTTTALAVVETALKATNKWLRYEAVQSLAEWCNESAAELLLQAARGSSGASDYVLAIGGYVRIVGMKGTSLSPSRRAMMLRHVASMPLLPKQKKQIAIVVGTVWSADALSLACEYLKDPALREDAERSAAEIAWNMRLTYPDLAADAARRLVDSSDKTVADRAKQILEETKK